MLFQQASVQVWRAASSGLAGVCFPKASSISQAGLQSSRTSGSSGKLNRPVPDNNIALPLLYAGEMVTTDEIGLIAIARSSAAQMSMSF
jgi:hypothetical protein